MRKRIIFIDMWALISTTSNPQNLIRYDISIRAEYELQGHDARYIIYSKFSQHMVL